MSRNGWLVAVLVGTIAGRAFGEGDAAAQATAVAQSLIAADNARDVARVLAHYTDDVLFLPPDRAPYGGKPALRERYTALFAANQVALVLSVAEADAAGNLAVLRGEITGAVRPLDPARAETRVHDKFLMVLRRQPDGAWKVARLMWGPFDPVENNRR